MLPNQKSKADFVSVDDCPEIPESEARQIIYDAFSAFSEASPRGLNASKYAPQNLKEENSTPQNKVGGTQNKGRGLGASKYAPKNTERTKENEHNKPSNTHKSGQGLYTSKHAPKNLKQTNDPQRNKPNVLHTQDNYLSSNNYASRDLRKASEAPRDEVKPIQETYQSPKTTMAPPVNFDDTSAFLAAMNRNVPTASAASGTGESKPSASPSVKSEDPATTNMSSPETNTELQGASTPVSTVPAGATRLVQIIGVEMDRGMDWLYRQVTHGGREVEKVLDTFTPGGPRTVTFQFQSIESAVASFSSFKENPAWHGCQIDFALETSI